MPPCPLHFQRVFSSLERRGGSGGWEGTSRGWVRFCIMLKTNSLTKNEPDFALPLACHFHNLGVLPFRPGLQPNVGKIGKPIGREANERAGKI